MRKFKGGLDAAQPTLANYMEPQEFARLVVDKPWLIASQSDCLMIVLAELMRAKKTSGEVTRRRLDYLIGAGRGVKTIKQLRDFGFWILSSYDIYLHWDLPKDDKPEFDGWYMLSNDPDVDWAAEALSFGRHDAQLHR